MEKQRILVMLDALLDTRIATVSKLSESAAVGLLGPDYFERYHDDFGLLTKGVVSTEAYQAAYAARDLETLQRSQMTGIVVMLNKMVATLQIQRVNTPMVDEVTLEVNIWPYSLTSEQGEMYLTCIAAYIGMETPVTMVNIPPSALTPKAIAESWEAVILYDLDEWLKIHQEALIKFRIPRNTLIAPARSATGPLDLEELVRQGVTEHPFATCERELAEFVGLDLIEMKYCSLPPP